MPFSGSGSNAIEAARALLTALRKPRTEEKFAPAFGGDTSKMGHAAMVAREGHVSPELEGASKEELAELDRFGQFEQTGKDTGYLGLPSALLAAGGYEAFGKNPKIGHLLSKLTGDAQYEIDETSSKPSLGNVLAAARGFLKGAGGR